MGYSMARLFAQWPLAQVLVDLKGVTWSYPAAYASLAACTGVEKETALTAYLWSWVENQVLAAMKIVPLGQVEGQELLHRLKEDIPAACLVAQSIRITEAGSAAFGLALTSTRHETQYSRLFRS
jgi:urease accessory protein